MRKSMMHVKEFKDQDWIIPTMMVWMTIGAACRRIEVGFKGADAEIGVQFL